MSLLAELQRRKVFKIGVAYLVAAWLVIQVGATVAPQLGLPDWAPRLITLLTLLGFPLALLLAWLFDFSTEGVRFEPGGVGNKRVLLAVVILAALSVGWFVRGGWPVGKTAAEAGLGAQSVAVLPFVNMSADKDNEYFSDGLTETLLHKLAQVNDLKVAARTSSFAFKGKQEDVRTIGKELGVAALVEGSVQRAGDTLRITAQLVRTLDGSHVWSRSYDRKQTDLFAIQDEIAGAVTAALIGALVPEAQAAIAHGGTKNLAAYDDYTRGLQQTARFTFDSLRDAERLFQQALTADPDYVDAMVALVWNWEHMQYTGLIGDPEFEARATPWLDRIEARDPGNASLLGFRAHLAGARGERAEARRLYQRAVDAAPNNTAVRESYAQFLRRFDRQAAVAQMDRVVELDPANSSMHTRRAFMLKDIGRLEEATRDGQRSIELDPRQPNAYGVMAEIADASGDAASGIAWRINAHEVDPKDHEIATLVGLSLAEIAEFAAADAWFDAAERLAPGHPFVASRRTAIPFIRGDFERALAEGLRFGPRAAENVKESWYFALGSACAAGALLGRGADVRARLETFQAIPRELTTAGFRALDLPHVPLPARLEGASGFVGCMFGGSDDAKRKRDLLAAYVEVLGPNWAEPHWLWFIDGFLRDDRERMIQALLPRPGREHELTDISWDESQAKIAGLLDDPRLTAHFAEIHERLAQARSELPKRLQERHLNLLP